MPRLHKQLGDSGASGEGGTFERFIASAIATLVTILLSWRILVDLIGSDGGQKDGVGDQCLAATTEQVASGEIGVRGKDQQPSKEQAASNVVVVDMGETVSVNSVPSQPANTVIQCGSTGKMTGRTDRMNKVYKYLNLAIPSDSEQSRTTIGMDTDTHSLDDTSSEDDAVTVIEKPVFTEETDTNTAVEVAIMRDVIDVSRRPLGLPTRTVVTSPQTYATGCDVHRTRDHGDRACPKHCGLPVEREIPRYAGQGQIADLLSRSGMTGSKPIATEVDDTIGRHDGGCVLGRSPATPEAKVADTSVLWPSKATHNVKINYGRAINNDGAPISTDVNFVGEDGDHAGHSGQESLSCDIQPAAIAKITIPDVFKRDVSSLCPTCAPLTSSDSANDNGRNQRYRAVDNAYGSVECVKQTCGQLNQHAIPSPVTSGHSPASRVSTCLVAAVDCSLPGISSDPGSPGQRIPAAHTDYLATIGSSQRRHCSQVDDRNGGVYVDARLSSGVQPPPTRCVFVKTEFIAHDYCIRSTNVVEVGLSDNASTASNNRGLYEQCNTAALGANRKTNNATNVGCNINTSVQSATKKCAPEVNLYNPRCSDRHVITSTDSSMNEHLPNTAVQQVCATSTTTTPECCVSIDQLSAQNVCCPVYDTASSHDMISWPTESQYWKRHDRNTTVVPHVKTADISQCTDISPSSAVTESNIHDKWGADIIINHKYRPSENRASHLARADLSSRGIGDSVGGVRKADPASEVDIIYAGRGGSVVGAAACGVGLPGDSLACPAALSCHVTNDRQISTRARPNSRQVDRDVHKHGCVVGQEDSRNYQATGRMPTLQRHDGAIANRGIPVRSSGIQEAPPGGISQHRYDGAGTLHNCVTDYSQQRRPEHRVNRNTAVNTQSTVEHEHGNIDVHRCSDIFVPPRCNDRASPAMSTGRSASHGYSLRGECDANIGTAKRPTREHVHARIDAETSTVADQRVSTGLQQYNTFDLPMVHNVANASITEHRNIVDKPEFRRPLKSQGQTDVLPMEVTSRTNVRSILKGSQSPSDNNRWSNGTAKKNDAEMNIGVLHGYSNDKRNGDNISSEKTNEQRFENVLKPDCAHHGHAKRTGFRVFEIEFNDKTSGVCNASATDNGRHIRCDNEHQSGGEPPPNHFACIDAYQHDVSDTVRNETKDVAGMAYDAIDPVGNNRCSPGGYRLNGGGEKRRARSMATLACEFFADRSSRTSLIETDLDTGEERLTPLVRETDIDYARSMTELAGASPVDDEVMTRSLMTLPSDHDTPVEVMLSANELRIRQSLSKLSVPRWYAGASGNGNEVRLRNINRAGVMPSPRTSLYLSTPNVSRGAGRDLTKPVVINYRVKAPLRARTPVPGPSGEFELPSARFRRQPSAWPRMETRQPPQSDRPSRPESAREAYLRLKHEQQAARGRNGRDNHGTPKTNAGETAERRSVGTRSFRSVCLTTPPGHVMDASLRTRSRGINEWARRHSGGKGGCPVMGTRINVAELKQKSTKPDMECTHRTNANNGNSAITSTQTSVCQSPRSDASTVRDSSYPERKQMEDVLDGLLCIPSTLPGNNISPSSSPLRHRPSDIAVTPGDDDDNNRDVIVTCRNTECGRQASLSEARTCYKTCHNCYTYYCSRACRQAHWQRHKRRCVFSRVGSVCKHVIRTVHDDATLSAEMTRVARAGYLAVGRGCVRMLFPSQNDADSFLHRHGSAAILSPTFVSLAELKTTADSAAVDEHFFELTDLCKTYNPQVKYVIDVTITTAEVGDSEDVSASPTRRAGDARTVSKCAKLRHHLPASPRHTTRPEPDTLILTAVPGAELTENVAGSRARQICFVNMQRKLRQRGVSLRHQYPGVYDKLCAYVAENEHFAPITLFPLDRRTGRKFMCLIMPNSEPDVAWMHQPDILDEIGLSTAV